MTEKEFKKAEKLKAEIKNISTTLKHLSEIYYELILSRDNGIEKRKFKFLSDGTRET